MFESLSVEKLYNDLDEWIFIGIDADIYEAPDHRPEYNHLVIEAKGFGLYGREISKYVLLKLEKELKLPWYKQRTFWHLCKVLFKRAFRWLLFKHG